MNNMSKVLFSTFLIMSSIISMSSNSLFGMWMGLEINLLSFIPLMMMKKNLNSSEASLTYFLVQALSSSYFFMSIMMNLIYLNMFMMSMFKLMSSLSSLMMISSMMMKLGAAPFHMWVSMISEMISWNLIFIMLTWQKIAPLTIIYYMKINKTIFLFWILSTIMGTIGGLNQNSMRKIIAFSSINHMGWLLASMMINQLTMIFYFTMYSLMNFSLIISVKFTKSYFINQMFLIKENNNSMKIFMLMNMLSVGGMPPLTGFFPKLMIIHLMISMNLSFMSLLSVMMSIITLSFYLKIMINSTFINSMELTWQKKSHKNNSTMMNIMVTTNCASMFLMILMINLTFNMN